MPPFTAAAAYELGSADALSKFAFFSGVSPTLAQRIASAIVQGGTGVAMNLALAPPGEKVRSSVISALADGAGGFVGGVPGMFLSPALNLTLRGMTTPRHGPPVDGVYDFSQEKVSDHADDRLRERVTANLPPDALEQLRQQVQSMKVRPGRYYLTLNDEVGNPAGVAAFKTVGPSNQLVLSTILRQPPATGVSLSHVLRQPSGKIVGKADATPKQYTIRQRDDGTYTCGCRDYRYRQAASGGMCKHIRAHFGESSEPPKI